MVEAMMSMKKIVKANAVAVAATSVVAKVNPMPPSSLNQMNHPTSTRVGKDLGSASGPRYAQIQNKHAFPPYGSPPKEDVNNSAPKCPKLIPTQPPELFDPSRKFPPNSNGRASCNKKNACPTHSSSHSPTSQ